MFQSKNSAPMFRILLIIVTLVAAAGCSSKQPPPPAKNYELEALQNEVLQIHRFIDNWSGFDQQYSRINSLSEYREVKHRIRLSPHYRKLNGRAEFESRTSQFDAVVNRYEAWVAERRDLLDKMDRFSQRYRDSQRRIFAANARPIYVGDYGIVVANAYYAMVPSDPDQAYDSTRAIGLKQLDIIAASRDEPLRLPTQQITDFVAEVRISNRSQGRILRPDGFISHRHSSEHRSDSFILKSYREYLVKFSDDLNNSYQFNRADGVINKDSENGIRPGESLTWTYSFNRDNHPLEAIKKFQISFPEEVFGRALTLAIPRAVIAKPSLPGSF